VSEIEDIFFACTKLPRLTSEENQANLFAQKQNFFARVQNFFAHDSTGPGKLGHSLLTLYLGGFLTRRRACLQASGVSAIHGAGEPPTERRWRRGEPPAKQCAKRSL